MDQVEAGVALKTTMDGRSINKLFKVRAQFTEKSELIVKENSKTEYDRFLSEAGIINREQAITTRDPTPRSGQTRHLSFIKEEEKLSQRALNAGSQQNQSGIPETKRGETHQGNVTHSLLSALKQEIPYALNSQRKHKRTSKPAKTQISNSHTQDPHLSSRECLKSPNISSRNEEPRELSGGFPSQRQPGFPSEHPAQGWVQAHEHYWPHYGTANSTGSHQFAGSTWNSERDYQTPSYYPTQNPYGSSKSIQMPRNQAFYDFRENYNGGPWYEGSEEGPFMYNEPESLKYNRYPPNFFTASQPSTMSINYQKSNPSSHYPQNKSLVDFIGLSNPSLDNSAGPSFSQMGRGSSLAFLEHGHPNSQGSSYGHYPVSLSSFDKSLKKNEKRKWAPSLEYENQEQLNKLLSQGPNQAGDGTCSTSQENTMEPAFNPKRNQAVSMGVILENDVSQLPHENRCSPLKKEHCGCSGDKKISLKGSLSLEGLPEKPKKALRASDITAPMSEKTARRVTVTNISGSKAVTIEMLFNLFSLYGRVSLIQRSCNAGMAWVDFEEEAQAKSALLALDGCIVFGKSIRVAQSQEKRDYLEKNGLESKDFSVYNEEMYRPKGNGELPDGFSEPSSTLVVSNIHANASEEFLFELFGRVSSSFEFLFSDLDDSVAFVSFESIDEAVQVLMFFHNFDFSNR